MKPSLQINIIDNFRLIVKRIFLFFLIEKVATGFKIVAVADDFRVIN